MRLIKELAFYYIFAKDLIWIFIFFYLNIIYIIKSPFTYLKFLLKMRLND